MYTFNSDISVGKKFLMDEPSEDMVKNEPMFFNSSVRFAMEFGGPITKAFLSSIPEDWAYGIFDSRVHMLMKDWHPCIPGYHHDDVPRNTNSGQPNYINPSYKSQHIMGLVNGAICPTKFALGACSMPEVPEGKTIYREWHLEIERLIKDKQLSVVHAPSLYLVHFDCNSFHSGQKAIRGGWRWFGRISRNTDRCNNKTNEIRRQVQVYLEFPIDGW